MVKQKIELQLILIVESGSTKADWVLIGNKAIHSTFKTVGLNPFSNSDYSTIISQTSHQKLLNHKIEKVYFYGSGIMGDKEKMAVADGFKSLNQATIEVNDDLIAAAIATCGVQKGVVCILGTGSNIGYYDGEQIVDKVASGGYLLGAEGSGMAFGREILKMYIRDQLSTTSAKLLESEYGISKENIFDKVYSQKIVNRYIASFAPLVAKMSESEKKHITHKVFTEFVEERILKLNASASNPIHFVGSIAYSYQEELEDIMKSNNLVLGNIVEKPIDNLVKHHIQHN